MDGGGATWWRRLHRLRGRPPPERELPQRRLSRWSSQATAVEPPDRRPIELPGLRRIELPGDAPAGGDGGG
jgi:hypothetical protein